MKQAFGCSARTLGFQYSGAIILDEKRLAVGSKVCLSGHKRFPQGYHRKNCCARAEFALKSRRHFDHVAGSGFIFPRLIHHPYPSPEPSIVKVTAPPCLRISMTRDLTLRQCLSEGLRIICCLYRFGCHQLVHP